MGIAEIIGAIMTILAALMPMIVAKVGDDHAKAKKLAAIEAEESYASMAAVDAEYDKLRQPKP